MPDGCRDSAALLLAYPRDDEAHLVLTLRDEALPHHAGQVSLTSVPEQLTDQVLMAAMHTIELADGDGAGAAG